jgi:hypothetical protein
MAGFILGVHNLDVWLILAAAAVALVAGLAWLALTRRASSTTGADGAITADPTVNLTARIFRYALLVCAGLGVLQALLGGLLLLFGDRPRDNLHFVYGLIVALAVPVAFAYSDQRQVRRDIIIMTIAAAAILGAAVRAWMTGP